MGEKMLEEKAQNMRCSGAKEITVTNQNIYLSTSRAPRHSEADPSDNSSWVYGAGKGPGHGRYSFCPQHESMKLMLLASSFYGQGSRSG